MTTIEQIQTVLGVTVDNEWGPKSQAAMVAADTDTKEKVQALLSVFADGEWGPVSQAALDSAIASGTIPAGDSKGELTGDRTWPWSARIDGDDIVVTNARATCFGGSDDPQDDGETASGISTKDNPDLAAVSLPMDFGDKVPNTKGSPIPKVPWRTPVRVSAMGQVHEFPVIDIGPAKRTGNALDLTLAAARLFDPRASAKNFEMRCEYRILGGARFAT